VLLTSLLLKSPGAGLCRFKEGKLVPLGRDTASFFDESALLLLSLAAGAAFPLALLLLRALVLAACWLPQAALFPLAKEKEASFSLFPLAKQAANHSFATISVAALACCTCNEGQQVNF